ncbi:deoxyribodipyrimidine photo-lyase [Microbacter margulisiae]|uniref:Deoxyribodipyrimidine photo-lyase n=1 Tax=Microbacter margulisiae TaxID=1350067 RepID=A0A7W5DPU4_9PORP|nr:deoxyribodipyrimidine photo-lyase [Microbacter margulisiae]MBB3186088.1 deoxyribodipyrimidine photo-lyase [Microbacter margulisiae]
MEVDVRRVIVRKDYPGRKGLVVYRMSRDQRVDDNWALLFAQQLADVKNEGLAVVFTLVPHYPNANRRHFDFMIRGLKQVEKHLAAKNIPFFLLMDEQPMSAFADFIREYDVSAVVSDFDPLRHKQAWNKMIDTIDAIAHYEVDAHNIVPCHFVSRKVEFGAYTLRPKIKRLLPDFLTEFPELHPQTVQMKAHPIDWVGIKTMLSHSENVEPVNWLQSGEEAAKTVLDQFIATKLSHYDEQRNHPEADGQSHLSPYLHFGQIAAQRVALEIIRNAPPGGQEAFLEELIVRRELADNFCYYNPLYDQTGGFPEWAKKDMELHRNDVRLYLYTREELENGETHDPLWNAAQRELTVRGKMHGYLRMYWAKKLLEWTASPEEALQHAIYLNDKYSLDGRDPNGYAGIAWSIGGVHDRAWFPRPVFGKIRYMSLSGCFAKFDVDQYIREHSK